MDHILDEYNITYHNFPRGNLKSKKPEQINKT